jgi:DNA-binding LacI/PurR family transcriptional regulator
MPAETDEIARSLGERTRRERQGLVWVHGLNPLEVQELHGSFITVDVHVESMIMYQTMKQVIPSFTDEQDPLSAPDLSERLADLLRDEFLAASKPGDRLLTLRDICARFGVSINTVRAAVKLLQREGLVELRQGRGIHRRRPSADWCVGVYSEQDLLNPDISPFWPRLMHAARVFLREHAVRTRCYIGHVEPGEPGEVITEPTCLDFIEDVAAGRLHGVLSIGNNAHPSWKAWIDKRRLPLVSTHSLSGGGEVDRVRMIRQGVESLRQSGCRRVALLAWGCEQLREPFVAAARAAGMDVYPEWIRGDLEPSMRGAGWEEFREIWTARAEKPDGVLVGDEMLYRDACIAISECRIAVPAQLRLVTHWTLGVDFVHPWPVTLLEHDVESLGRGLGEMLWHQLRGEPFAPVKFEFNVRAVGAAGRARKTEAVSLFKPTSKERMITV